MSKGRIAAIVIAIIGTCYFAAAPYVTAWSMKAAAQEGDGEALSEHIDFPAVRQNLKDQINAMMLKEMSSDDMKDNPFAALGAALAGTLVEKMVDAYVTPAGIVQLMAGDKVDPKASNVEEGRSAREPFKDARMSYSSFDKFVIAVPSDSSEDGRFILRRRGIGWKLTEILIPVEK